MRARALTLVCLSVVVPVGFAFKLYRGGPGAGPAPLQHYINNSLAGVAYEVFWCLVAFLVWPRRAAILPICATVFVATTALEVLQLWSPAPPHPLGVARSTFLGRTLLGTTFSWMDIPHYALGCVLGGLCLLGITQAEKPEPAGSGGTPTP